MAAFNLYNMKKFTFLFLLLTLGCFGQVTTSPAPPLAEGPVTLTFNKTGTGLATYAGTIYAHIGVTVNGQTWQYVKGSWGNNTTQPALTSTGANNYQLQLTPNLYSYFGVPAGSTITQICVVFRSADGTQKHGSNDIFINVGSFQANLTAPVQNSNTIIASGSDFTITASNTGGNANYVLSSNGAVINSNPSTSSYSFTHTGITANQNYSLVISQGTSSVTKKFSVIVNPGTVTAAMPVGMIDGINYNTADNTRATLVLDAPGKDFVYVAGSFNGWLPTATHAMKKDGATGKFWLELTGLVPNANQPHTYQYWVVDETPVANSPKLVKTADPYSTLVLVPEDDQYIPAASYPNLPAYPAGQEREVTVLQTVQTPYNWQVTSFAKPKKEDLVIYEVLVRDFDGDRNYQDLIDKMDYFKNLGINALELMPVMEFEGNESWGYNTSFHMATDKFYGPSNKLKELIDLCHQNGIAVILDVALNHAFGRNPMNRMWMVDPDGDGYGDPSSESPYFNTMSMHSYGVGSDFNHQKPLTKNYVKRVVKHWIEEYHIDGFRWDLTKGFTQNCPNNEGCTNTYQQDRVDVLKEYADYSWSLDPTHYTIFEHLGNANEEKEWANYKLAEGKGVMMWGNINGPYNELSMGYTANISNVGHNAHAGFTGKRVVGYAESHDEERLMYKNLQYGNSANLSHNVKSLNTALSRMSAIGAVLIPVPGPKMLWQFGELGWDRSIFTCNNGTVNNPTDTTTGDCKLDTKPQPQWTENWMANVQRKQVYDNWARMIALKKEKAVFEGDYTMTSGSSLLQRIHVYNNSLPATDLKNVIVIANFGVTAQNINPEFTNTGAWYNLMDDMPYPVTNTTTPISLQPGEFRMYGNMPAALGTGDVAAERTAALYPNPTADVFTIDKSTAKVEIYSVTGQLVKAFDAQASYYMFDVSDLNTGMYLVKITDTENRQSTTKLIRK
jgi:hypothetical protein